MLNGIRVLAIIDDVYEELELWYPRIRLEEEHATVTVAAPVKGTIAGKHGYPAVSDIALEDVRHEDYQALLLPGGFAPDRLRRRADVKDITRAFAASNRLIACICHGGWIPVSARILKGFRMTGSAGIRDDLENAGAIWEDAPVVVDRNLISSRTPADLRYFARAIVDYLRRR